MKYLLDANVFIEAKNRYYGFDFCPAFWDWLLAAHGIGLVHSVEKVGDELRNYDDALARWASERGTGFFLPLDENALDSLRQVSAWVHSQKYTPAAIQHFLEKADYFLVGQARALGCIVVTHELAEQGHARVKIPNVCIGTGVRFMTTWERLRTERARFVLGSAASSSVRS